MPRSHCINKLIARGPVDDDIHLFDGIVLVNVGESKPSRSFPILVGNPTLLLQDGTFKRKIQLNEMKIKNY